MGVPDTTGCHCRPAPFELEIMDMGEIRRTCVFLTEKVDVVSIRAVPGILAASLAGYERSNRNQSQYAPLRQIAHLREEFIDGVAA